VSLVKAVYRRTTGIRRNCKALFFHGGNGALECLSATWGGARTRGWGRHGIPGAHQGRGGGPPPGQGTEVVFRDASFKQWAKDDSGAQGRAATLTSSHRARLPQGTATLGHTPGVPSPLKAAQ